MLYLFSKQYGVLLHKDMKLLSIQNVLLDNKALDILWTAELRLTALLNPGQEPFFSSPVLCSLCSLITHMPLQWPCNDGDGDDDGDGDRMTMALLATLLTSMSNLDAELGEKERTRETEKEREKHSSHFEHEHFKKIAYIFYN